MATLSVVVPCFNEQATIGAILDAVRAAPVPDKEIIVVDDGSTDGTRELLEGELRAKVDTLVVHDKNRGKGAALRSGFEPEITAKISKFKVHIYEVGISYYGRTYSEGKKIDWKDGVRPLVYP